MWHQAIFWAFSLSKYDKSRIIIWQIEVKLKCFKYCFQRHHYFTISFIFYAWRMWPCKRWGQYFFTTQHCNFRERMEDLFFQSLDKIMVMSYWILKKQTGLLESPASTSDAHNNNNRMLQCQTVFCRGQLRPQLTVDGPVWWWVVVDTAQSPQDTNIDFINTIKVWVRTVRI